MRTHFDQVAPTVPSPKGNIEAFLYMSYWYAGLHVVIEGWRELKLSDPIIDGLLQSPNVDLLRRYRNGAFHFQKDYIDKRFMELIEDGVNPVRWVRELNEQFGRFFLEEGKPRQPAK
jgi:hypothetical protein